MDSTEAHPAAIWSPLVSSAGQRDPPAPARVVENGEVSVSMAA